MESGGRRSDGARGVDEWAVRPERCHRLGATALMECREARERSLGPEISKQPMRSISVNVSPESVCDDSYLAA